MWIICGPIALVVGLVVFIFSVIFMPLPYPFEVGWEAEVRRIDARVGIVIGGLLFLGGFMVSLGIMISNI